MSKLSWILGPLAALGVAAVPASALAQDSDACNDIDVSADTQCTVLVDAECTTQCEPISFDLACSGECNGVCNEVASETCVNERITTCVEQCEIDPGSFSCTASCDTDCQASCDAECVASDDAVACAASCSATCDTECTAQCEVVPPTADCQTICETSCQTSCTVERNLECSLDCRAECTGDLQGSCETRCDDPQGAIFCDGQFVDADDMQACVDWLASQDVEVDGWAEGQVTCDGNECVGTGTAGCTCTTGPGQPGNAAGALFLGAVTLGTIAWRRRRHAR